MPLYHPPKSRFWWFRFKVNGREFRGSTGKENRREAEAFERRKRSEVEARSPRKRHENKRTLADVAGLDVQRAISEGVDEDTRIATLEHMWSWLVRILGDCDPERINAQIVGEYVAARRKRRIRGQTIRREVQCLARGLRLAYRRGWVSARPDTDEWPRIRSAPPSDKTSGKLHDVEVVRRWLEQLHADARDEALFVLLTGLRAKELKRVRASWVRPAPADLGVPAVLEIPGAGAKTRKPRMVGLAQVAVDILARRTIDADVPIFSQSDFKKHRAAAAKRLGYQVNITLRDLRHCHLTWGMQSTGDARATLEAAGHTDLRTTQRYLHTTLARTTSVAHAVAGLLGGIPSVAHQPDTGENTKEDAA